MRGLARNSKTNVVPGAVRGGEAAISLEHHHAQESQLTGIAEACRSHRRYALLQDTDLFACAISKTTTEVTERRAWAK